jgi:ATP-dependent DNA helicase RecQ
LTKYEILKTVFGYDTFREGQETLIDSILSHRDTLGIMPTGAGKSICYQVPALMLPGISIIISPLISLMKDQVSALNQAGIHAAYINSSLTERQFYKAMENARNGQYKIIYVAPERLMTPSFLSLIGAVEISMVAVDEAHCISQWGQDFRPSYLKIVEFIDRLPTRPVLAAFTATATDVVRNDMIQILQLSHPTVVVTGYDRQNLYFGVRKPKNKMWALLRYMEEHANQSGIIYCNTRKLVEEVHQALLDHGYKAARYHAGLSDEERQRNQEAFVYDEIPVMVATNAFGMGIDKSNVRYVIHYNMPKDLESYYQEAGRAGRDGEPAECILFYAGQDMRINEFMISRVDNEEMSEEEQNVVIARNKERLKRMTFYCHTKYCLREYILRYFGEKGYVHCNNCSICLGQEEPMEEYARMQTAYGLPKRKKEKPAPKKSKTQNIDVKDEELFELLRQKRLEIARRINMPPYIVFSDRTLKEMCNEMPDTKEKMMDINGVGENKFERFGEEFIDVIRSYKK